LLDEALRIRTEEQLPVYQRLGDVRELAVTQGQIADILHARGKTDEALALREEGLATARRLGDIEGVAASLWSIAQIELDRKQFEQALPRLAEAWPPIVKLGRPDGIAAIGGVFGQFLAAQNLLDQARDVLGQAAAAYRKLGRAAQAAQIEAMMADINKRQSRGDADAGAEVRSCRKPIGPRRHISALGPEVKAHRQPVTEASDAERKAVDPISLATLILSIPTAVLAVIDIVDRLKKRPKAQAVIDAAKQAKAEQQVDIYLLTLDQTPQPVADLTPTGCLTSSQRCNRRPARRTPRRLGRCERRREDWPQGAALILGFLPGTTASGASRP
jgi:tetratricopeptide (TPR) repeat protein